MKTNYKYFSSVLALGMITLFSCKKPVPGTPTTIDADYSLKLKDAAAFPIGVGGDYDLAMNDAQYWSTIADHFNSMTFGYVMKHGSIVQNDGSYDYTKPDALLAKCQEAGIQVFGHTLCWHQNNNGVYLANLLKRRDGDSIIIAAPNLLQNNSFEAGTGDNFDHWSKWNGAASLTQNTDAANVYGGVRSLKVTVATGGNPWNIQMVSDDIATTVGTSYTVKLYVKAVNAGGKIRCSNNGGSAQYGGDLLTTTDWTLYTWTFSSNNATKKLVLDLGYVANTYYIDSLSVTAADGGSMSGPPPPTFEEQSFRIDSVLHDYITKTVTHYKGKVKAWDVLNEPLQENGAFRNDTNAVSDYFPWFHYVGGYDSLLAKTFRWAHEADPDAILFLNDYNLESNATKLNAFVSVVEGLKAAGVPIGGVGTQMHMTISNANTGLDNMLYKLGQTGLQVRISELDMRISNSNKNPNFVATPTMLEQQGAKYKYVVESYYTNIPAAQRHGITIWGVTDADSWLVNDTNLDFPLLWNKDYEKKPAFTSFLQGLQLQ